MAERFALKLEKETDDARRWMLHCDEFRIAIPLVQVSTTLSTLLIATDRVQQMQIKVTSKMYVSP